MQATRRWLGQRLAIAALVGVSFIGPIYSESVNISGHVRTRQGMPAYDIVVSLVKAGIADTTRFDGSFRLYNLTAPIAYRDADAPVSVINNENVNGAYKRLRVVGIRNPVPAHSGVDLVSLNGRVIIGPEQGRASQIAPGVVALFAGTAHSDRMAVGAGGLSKALAVTDTVKVSYRDTVLMAIPVDISVSPLEIQLNRDIPARKHRILVASYSNNAAYTISESGQVQWSFSVPGSCQDAWMLPNGNVLVAGGNKICEVRPDRTVAWEYTGGSNCGEIHNCQPLPNGDILYGENGTGRLLEIGRDKTIHKEIQTAFAGGGHDRFRMVRKYDTTYVICARGEDNLYVLGGHGQQLRKLTKDAMNAKFGSTFFNGVHSAILLPNGNLFVGGGYGGFYGEIDARDSIVWKLSPTDLPAELGMGFAAGCQMLPDGNLLISAYSGSYKVFEITRDKRVVWKALCNMDPPGNVTHVQALDVRGDAGVGDLMR